MQGQGQGLHFLQCTRTCKDFTFCSHLVSTYLDNQGMTENVHNMTNVVQYSQWQSKVLLLIVQYVQCLSVTFTHYRQGAVDHCLSNSVIKYFTHATCKY